MSTTYSVPTISKVLFEFLSEFVPSLKTEIRILGVTQIFFAIMLFYVCWVSGLRSYGGVPGQQEMNLGYIALNFCIFVLGMGGCSLIGSTFVFKGLVKEG